MARAPALGAGYREFESHHSDYPALCGIFFCPFASDLFPDYPALVDIPVSSEIERNGLLGNILDIESVGQILIQPEFPVVVGEKDGAVILQ